MLAAEIALKTTLFPVLIAQALRVRRQAQLLPEPPGARAGVAGAGPELRLMILGDSSAAGVGAAHQKEALSGRLVAELSRSHRVSWRLEAVTGATTGSTLARLDGLPRAAYDIVILVLGVNDVTSQLPLSRLRARRRELHHRLRSEFSARRIIAAGLPPMRDFALLPPPLSDVLGLQAARFDEALALDAEADGVEYMRFALPLEPHLMATDGFHPSAAAYAIWAGLAAERIRAG
ncbi:SGNH/GDSL hydrolase family protein [Aliiroseovarius sp.]|uniref:SGNH/GDSL hydrolase family protein n=1 Tax=Aliiroseovarius sp. TaxID=1872442 RepID=UPI00260A4CF1|nr:SGNH/GDSL hydrolase family protein [Aliiroseovarius sp.]